MVSPGNPLKPAYGMAGLAERLASTRRVADGRRIVATDIERRLGTRYTLDTVRALRRRFPRVRFVWLMGADVLAELPRWHCWQALVRIVAFVVLPRPGYTRAALAGRAATCLRAFRIPAQAAATLVDRQPPAWVFLPARETAASATALRRSGQQAGCQAGQQ